MIRERVLLQELLHLLLAEQGNAPSLVYLPSGCREMRRMIRQLLLMRPFAPEGDRVSQLLDSLREAGCPIEKD